jgi:hypothetical protein
MTTTTAPRKPKPWLRRIGWLVLIWAASILALAVVAAFLRLLMSFASLTV